MSADYPVNGGRGADYCRHTAAMWMAAPHGPAMDAIADRAAILHRTPPVEAPGPNVDHTPGGGPLHTVPSEPAPSRMWRPVSPDARRLVERDKARRLRWERETVPVEAAMNMAKSAAAMSLKGDDWTPDDRADCMSAILTALMETVPDPGADRYPVRFASYGWLVGRGADWRRAAETRRRAERDRVALDAATLRGHYSDPDPVETVTGTPWGARRRAVEMLRDIGALDAVVHWGPVWTLAYSAARLAANVDAVTGEAIETDPTDVADELELSTDTYRQHMSRAPGRLPASGAGFSRYDWREALNLPTDTAGRAVKPSKTRSAHRGYVRHADTSGRGDGWRGLDAPRPDPAPVLCSVMGEDPGADDYAPCLHCGAATEAPHRENCPAAAIDPASWRGDAPAPAPPEWARTLKILRPSSAARLSKLASMKRARMDAKTDEQRAVDRHAAGIPALVR